MPLWSQYTARYGSSNTVGFSLGCADDCTQKMPFFSQVYGGSLPPVFELHMYAADCPGIGGTYDHTIPIDTLFSNVLGAMNQYSMGGTGWIIGETCNNDATTAQKLHNVMVNTGHLVYFIQQWDSLTNQQVPVQYNNWHAYGF